MCRTKGGVKEVTFEPERESLLGSVKRGWHTLKLRETFNHAGLLVFLMIYTAGGGVGTRKEDDRFTEEKQMDYLVYLNKLKSEFQERWRAPPAKASRGSELERLRTLGTGAFGRVILVKHKETSKYYAMKVLDKQKMVKMKQVSHVLQEKKILEALRFGFVVYMQFSFKDNLYVYFVMPFIQGGEMFTHLKQFGKFEESLAKFYACQVILALEYLHHCDLVYRDLKPENILVDRTGYLKITDFGFCKSIKDRTYTMCGTPEYLAPEIILSKGYGKAVDWWSFGILVYEMNAGYPPFYSNKQMKMYEKIVSGKFKQAPNFGDDLKDFLKSTLQVDVSRRLGNLKNGAMDFKSHVWLKDMNWDAVLHKKITPSFVPVLQSDGDTTNFDHFEDDPLKTATFCLYEKEFSEF